MSTRRNLSSFIRKENGTVYQVVPRCDSDETDAFQHVENVTYNGIDQQGYEKIYMFGDISTGFKTVGPLQNFYELRQHHAQNQTLFKDDNFPAETIKLTKLDGNVIWKRPFEISPNPRFVIDGATRFDVDQGSLGDCWFLAAIANLTTNQKLFSFVVPMDQGFVDNYVGIFHFRFWQYGRWVDVVVDDRLPTIDNKLVYLRSNDPNEFWTPLLEKAYAKFYGSYKNIEGGQITEALEDMCGGLSEFYRADRPEIYEIMKASYERSSFMGCSIVSSEVEGERSDGLITTHAYSVTSVLSITTVDGNEVKLLRLRNPWGNSAEWKGAWSDNSEWWNLVSEEIKDRILVQKNDGEFWMQVDDFQKTFTFVDICHLNPSTFLYSEGDDKKWNISLFDGAWVSNVTAGGGIRNTRTFPRNPQYFILVKGDDVNQTHSVVIGLMQKNRRVVGEYELPLELTVYKVPTSSTRLLDSAFFESNNPVLHEKEVGVRQLTVRLMLPVGKYCIIPSTSEANVYGEFLLRVYSELSANVMEVDDDIDYTNEAILNHSENVAGAEETVVVDALPNIFKKLTGSEEEVGWDKVQKVLNLKHGKRTFCFQKPKIYFSKDTCKTLVALWDTNYTGTLDYKEFWLLMKDVSELKLMFKKFEVQKSGKLNGFELRNLLNECGYKVNKQILTVILLRYGSKGFLSFENFVLCMFKLKSTIDELYKRRTDVGDYVNVDKKDWFKRTLYS